MSQLRLCLLALVLVGGLVITAATTVVAVGAALPDRVLLFETTRRRGFDSYLLDADHGIMQALAVPGAAGPGGGCYLAAWSPDGERVACRARGRGTTSFFLLNPLTAAVEPIRDASVEAGLAWSPDGMRLAYLIAGQQDGVGILDLRTGDRTQIRAAGFSARPACSPDGERIAFGATLDGLVIATADGQQRRVPGVPVNTIAPPVWLPDGETIIFQDGSPGSEQNLNRMDLRTGAIAPLTDGVYNGRPVLAPDGERLAFVRQQGAGYELVVLTLATGGIHVVSQRANTYTSASWSPDGVWIAFDSWGDDASGIYIVRADGTGERRITQSALDYIPRWRP